MLVALSMETTLDRNDFAKYAAQNGLAKLAQHVPVPHRTPGWAASPPLKAATSRWGVSGDDIAIMGAPAGLRDLARWYLVLSDLAAPSFAHVHLDPSVIPLTERSKRPTLARADPGTLR